MSGAVVTVFSVGRTWARDNVPKMCPVATDNAVCGNWCPACEITHEFVFIKCFPQPITVKVESYE